uniref:KRAB domain-containing protein n=1 Tax=Laticauda laticaudata TaxID=8630 RepID=A0A8C5S8X0_LATLA
LVSFEEVAVYFSEEEWSQMDAHQKALHEEVMLENSQNVASLGKSRLLVKTFLPNQKEKKQVKKRKKTSQKKQGEKKKSIPTVFRFNNNFGKEGEKKRC